MARQRSWLQVAIVATACAGAVGSACQPAGGSKQVEDGLEARARRFLELKQKQEWSVIYDEFLDPDVRQKLARETFLGKRKMPFDILSFELVSAKADGEDGEVRARLDAMIPVLNPKGGTSTMRKQLDDPQRWVSREGRWYIKLQS